MSVGGIGLFHEKFSPLLFRSYAAKAGDAESLKAVLEQHEEEVAAVIVEPLVQGAGGMSATRPAICARSVSSVTVTARC